ncbi:MAG: glycosyltransferase family 1 protein [Bacteroidota bacterium]
MNIIVNTRLLIPGKMEGIAWYAHEILSRMVHAHSEHHFHFVFDRPFDPEFIYANNVTGHVMGPQARHPLLYKWWFHRNLPKLMNRLKADLFFSPEGYLSLKTKVPQVNVIHDLGFEHFPAHLPKRELAFYQKYFPLYAQKAKKIITVSEFSKKDIVSKYGVEAEKVKVIYNGVRTALKKNSSSDLQRYFIYVGTLHPRKNSERMLRAFDQFIDQSNSNLGFKLVGRRMGKGSAIERVQASLKHKDRIEFLGYQSEERLAQLMADAEAMIYVPLFEGFGLPVLEAFQNNVPLICSNNSSLPEVAGNAALMVDAEDEHQLIEAMNRISSDESLRKELIQKGSEQVKKFSWDEAAQKTWKVIETCLV